VNHFPSNFIEMPSYYLHSRNNIATKWLNIFVIFLTYQDTCLGFEALTAKSPLEQIARMSTKSNLIYDIPLTSNFTTPMVEARSNRVRRDMFYFPSGSSLTIQFKLKSDVYSSTSTSKNVYRCKMFLLYD